MADHYMQASFAFLCTHHEMALLEEAFQAAGDLMHGDDPGDPSPDFLEIFPPVLPDARWSGFRAIFSDYDYPTLGADLEGGSDPHDVTRSRAMISGEQIDPEAIAALIQRCCRQTLAQGPIGFEWATTCSRLRIGEFGGGWCAIFADRIEIESTAEILDKAMREDIA